MIPQTPNAHQGPCSIVVTGASSGIGFQLARLLAERDKLRKVTPLVDTPMTAGRGSGKFSAAATAAAVADRLWTGSALRRQDARSAATETTHSQNIPVCG